MKEPTLQELNTLRKKGMRPGVVCFCVNDNKLLLLYKEEYTLWSLPQGGVENKEETHTAIKNELEEELGNNFAKQLEDSFLYLGTDEVILNKRYYGEKELEMDNGEKVPMEGKTYFIYAVAVKTNALNIKETEFDDYHWCNYTEAKFLLGRSYQVNRRDINLKFLEKLKENKLIK